MCHLLLFRLHSVWISMNFKQIINSQLECVLYSIMVFAVDWTISFAFSFPMLSFSLSHTLLVSVWLVYVYVCIFFLFKLFACLLFRFTVSAFCDEARFYLQKKKTIQSVLILVIFFIYLFVEFINLIFQFVDVFSDKMCGQIGKQIEMYNSVKLPFRRFNWCHIFPIHSFHLNINFELIFRFLYVVAQFSIAFLFCLHFFLALSLWNMVTTTMSNVHKLYLKRNYLAKMV